MSWDCQSLVPFFSRRHEDGYLAHRSSLQPRGSRYQADGCTMSAPRSFTYWLREQKWWKINECILCMSLYQEARSPVGPARLELRVTFLSADFIKMTNRLHQMHCLEAANSSSTSSNSYTPRTLRCLRTFPVRRPAKPLGIFALATQVLRHLYMSTPSR